MDLIKKVDAIKYKNGKREKVKEEIVLDNIIKLTINGMFIGKFSMLYDSLKEFAVGYLLGEGIIKSINEIEKIEIDKNHINVKINHIYIQKKEKILSSDASGGLRRKINEISTISSDLKVDSVNLIENMELITEKAKIWKTTGGTHVAALIFENKFILKEDVSRHVAVDKVIGCGALENIDFDNAYIIYSGRMPADMVIKLNRVKIPIIASNAAPSYSGFELVLKSNMTMLAFLRGKNFNVYGNFDRIIF